MFQFGSQSEPQPILDKGYFVLDKDVEDIVSDAAWIERKDFTATALVRDQPIAAPPGDVVPFAQREVMLPVNVEGINYLDAQRAAAVHAIVISLKFDVRRVRDGALPAAKDIAARNIRPFHGALAQIELVGGKDSANLSRVVIALKRQGVLVGRLPVQTESGAKNVPFIGRVAPGQIERVIPVEILGVNPVVSLVIDLSAVSNAAEAQFLRTRAAGDQRSLRVLCPPS